MQPELKYEAYRMEAVRKSAESTCFDKCIPEPDLATIMVKGFTPSIGGGSEVEKQRKYDLTENEALCIDRCSWKYMLTAKTILQTLAKTKNVKDPQQQGAR